MDRDTIKSIENCISVLQGDLHQPGTPAIVLKLAASWQKLKDFLSRKPLLEKEFENDSELSLQREQVSAEALLRTIEEGPASSPSVIGSLPPQTAAAVVADGDKDYESATVLVAEEKALDRSNTQSPGLLSNDLPS